MARGDIDMRVTLEEAQALQAFQRLAQKQNEVEAGTKKTGKAFKDQNTQMNEGAAMAMKFGGALAASFGIGSAAMLAVQAIKAEITNVIELQQKAATANIDAASARRDLIRNLPGVGDQSRQAFLDQANQLAADLSIKQKFVDQALAAAVSSTGGNQNASINAVRVAGRFMADRPEGIGDFAGSLADISAITGSRDMLANLGLLQFVGGRSRVVNPRQQAMNIPRALIGLRDLGFSTGGSAATFAALTTGAADLTGESSGTAGIALAEQLRSFFAERGGLTGESAIAALQADPGLAREFLGKSSFEKKFIGPIESLLLKPESPIARSYRETLGLIPSSNAALADIGRSSLAALENRGGSEQVAQLDRTLGGLTDQLYLNNPEAALGGVLRDQLPQILQAAGRGATSTKFAQIGFEMSSRFGTDRPVQATRDILLNEVKRLNEEAGRFQVQLDLLPGPAAQRLRTFSFVNRSQAESFVEEMSAEGFEQVPFIEGGAQLREVGIRDRGDSPARQRAERNMETLIKGIENMNRLLEQIENRTAKTSPVPANQSE